MARKEIPEHVVQRYGSARAFRAHKRKLARQMLRLLDDLRLGCAYMPDGSMRHIEAIDYELQMIAGAVSVKSWGR